jgi:hypothetical protein
VLLSLAGLSPAFPAVAQPAPAEPSEPPAKPQRSVVVVADVFADETQNAQLRARVYEAARRYGLESQPRADVIGTARDVEALEGGRVSTDRALLERMRISLGSTVLVRVSQDWERAGTLGVGVTAVRQGAAESRVVEAPAADPTAAVASGVDAVLATLLGAPAPSTAGALPAESQAAQGEEPPPVYVVTPGRPAVQEGPSAVAAGKAWDVRGGPRISYEVRGLATLLYDPEVAFSDVSPTGEAETGTADQWGIGGGVGVRAALLFLSLPDPSTSSGSGWWGVKLGAGLDGSIVYTRPPIGLHHTGRVEREDQVFFYPTGSLQLGLQFGIGRLQSPTIWRGVVLGVAYSPAVIWSLKIGESEFETDFNHAGFEVTLDIASLEARADITHEPQIRLFAFVLPRVRDELPWLMSAGIGAVWY